MKRPGLGGRPQAQSGGHRPGGRQLGATRAKFEYKPRSIESVKERAERQGGRYDQIHKGGVDIYKPKNGDNLIRFLPPAWDGDGHYGYTVWVHSYIGAENGSYLCLAKMLGKPCPPCDAAQEARQSGDDEEAYQLASSERILAWVLDRDASDPARPKLYAMSWTVDRDISSLVYDHRNNSALQIDNLDVGYDVTLNRQGTGLKTRYFGFQIARDHTPISEDPREYEEIKDYISTNPIPEILLVQPVEKLRKVILGVSDHGDDEVQEVARRRPAQRAALTDQSAPRRQPPAETYEEEVEYESGDEEAEVDDDVSEYDSIGYEDAAVGRRVQERVRPRPQEPPRRERVPARPAPAATQRAPLLQRRPTSGEPLEARRAARPVPRPAARTFEEDMDDEIPY